MIPTPFDFERPELNETCMEPNEEHLIPSKVSLRKNASTHNESELSSDHKEKDTMDTVSSYVDLQTKVDMIY